MPDPKRHTRTLRITVEADDQYLTDRGRIPSSLGWYHLKGNIHDKLQGILIRKKEHGDVRIVVIGWED